MEWRDVKGYEGKYLISDTGLVKSTLRNGRILKAETSSGVNKVTLYDKGKRETFLIYRLMVVDRHKKIPPSNDKLKRFHVSLYYIKLLCSHH